ncbi:MAG TPA: PKD domain-containing protein, partial [Jatrophihabitans sp.]
VTHTYTRTGDYTVSLTVRDKDGAKSTATQSVTVRPRGSVERDEDDQQPTGPGTPRIPTTGGSETLVLLAILGSAAAAVLSRRARRAA